MVPIAASTMAFIGQHIGHLMFDIIYKLIKK